MATEKKPWVLVKREAAEDGAAAVWSIGDGMAVGLEADDGWQDTVRALTDEAIPVSDQDRDGTGLLYSAMLVNRDLRLALQLLVDAADRCTCGHVCPDDYERAEGETCVHSAECLRQMAAVQKAAESCNVFSQQESAFRRFVESRNRRLDAAEQDVVSAMADAINAAARDPNEPEGSGT